METLGATIKNLREKNDLPLRKVAAHLDIDQAVLSKIEHGTRPLKREHVIELSNYFKIDKKLLLVKWLAEKILSGISEDEFALDAIQLAEAHILQKINQPKKAQPDILGYFKLGEATGMEKMFQGENLPTYVEFARYLFNTSTGEKFNENIINTHTGYIGESNSHEAYLFYRPDPEWLKHYALTLNMIKELPAYKNKRRLIFAPRKYVDGETCKLHHVDFCQLPYEIYQMKMVPMRNSR